MILGLFNSLTWHFGDDLIIAEPALVWAKTMGRVCPGPTGEKCSILGGTPMPYPVLCHTGNDFPG